MKPNRFCNLLGLALLIFCAGCATRRPEVSTWRDAQFTPSLTNTFAFTERPNPSLEDAELGRMLVTEMQREGFKFVPATQADFQMTYVLDDTTDERDILLTHPPHYGSTWHSPTPQTTGEIMHGSGTPQAYDVSTFVYHYKDVRLYVYTNPQTHPGRLQLVWQGNIEAGKSVTAERELQLLRTLLGYFGKDQNGPVNLVKQK